MDECLAVGVGMRVTVQVIVSVFLTSYESIEVKLHNVVPNELCVVHLHLEVLIRCLADDTLFLGVGDVGRIGRVL